MIQKNNNKKFGFSLFEALVSMLIMSLFFIASSRVITQKRPIEIQKNPYGYYECYTINGVTKQHRSVAESETPASVTDKCTFEPPAGANFVAVHFFRHSTYGTAYYNTMQIIFNEPVTFPSPGAVEGSGVFQGLEPMTNDDAVQTFKYYLKISHPSCYVNKYITEENKLPEEALIMSW